MLAPSRSRDIPRAHQDLWAPCSLSVVLMYFNFSGNFQNYRSISLLKPFLSFEQDTREACCLEGEGFVTSFGGRHIPMVSTMLVALLQDTVFQTEATLFRHIFLSSLTLILLFAYVSGGVWHSNKPLTKGSSCSHLKGSPHLVMLWQVFMLCLVVESGPCCPVIYTHGQLEYSPCGCQVGCKSGDHKTKEIDGDSGWKNLWAKPCLFIEFGRMSPVEWSLA